MKILVSALLCAGVLVATPVMAQQTVLKYSYVDEDNPSQNPSAAHAYVFKNTLEQLSGGQIKVEIYPNGQLGDQRSSVQQVRRGTIGVANISSGVLASLYYPQLGIVDLPFLYSTRANMDEVLGTDRPFIKKMIDDIAAKTGIRILSFDPYGFRYMTTSKKPIHSPADMKGLQMRTMEIVPHEQMMKSLGATPVPIPFLELYTSLQTGVVDGEENTPVNILQQKFYQVQKYLTLTGHLMTVGAILVNENWYKSLTPELRHAVVEAEKEADLAYAGVGAVQDTLALKDLTEKGMTIIAPTPTQLKEFRDATVGPAKTWAEGQYGKDFVDAFFANMDAVNQKDQAE